MTKPSKSRVFFIPAAASDPPGEVANKARRAFLALSLAGRLESEDFMALKIHFGEKNNTGYIKPAWLVELVHEVRQRTSRAFLTDSNTLYVGQRSNSVDHIRLAWSHGFAPPVLDLPIVIADGLVGRDKLETAGHHGRVASAKIASGILASDAMLCLSHVTGHVQAGVGAAVKNLGMGCASRAGKLDQHSVVHPRVNAKACRNCSLCMEFCPEDAILQAEGHVVIDDKKCVGCGECLVACKWGAIRMKWDEDSVRLQEKMAEYALLVRDHFGPKIGFLNFAVKITKDCDCMSGNQKPIVADIGLLASDDPVAIDQASVDLVLKHGGGRDAFREGYKVDWGAQLAHGEAIGLGRRAYELVTIY